MAIRLKTNYKEAYRALRLAPQKKQQQKL